MSAEPSRRAFLRNASLGFGWLAWTSLLAERAGANSPTRPPHFRPRAKNVIFLFMDGGVSHVDTFDPKPELDKRHGQKVGNWKPTPKSQSVTPDRKWLGCPWKFQRWGRS